MQIKDYQTADVPNWCPGCGNYGIQAALKSALASLHIPTHELVISTGIGCGSKINHWVKCYGFEGLHGRSLPVATGIKLSNPKLTVLAIGGDGDGYGLGMGHFIHSMRRNLDATYIVQDNQIYGLTTGQTSPTSTRGTKSKSTPFGAIEIPVNPISLALAAGATYVARGYAGDIQHLSGLIADAIAHPGFAIIDVLQPCVTFNKVNTYDFFNSKVYKLTENLSINEAFVKAQEWDPKIPIGIFYKEIRPTYESAESAYLNGSTPCEVPSEIDISLALKQFE